MNDSYTLGIILFRFSEIKCLYTYRYTPNTAYDRTPTPQLKEFIFHNSWSDLARRSYPTDGGMLL